MRITIVGGGNIGTQFAVHCAETGNEVIVYTSTSELYDGQLNIVDDYGVTTHEGEIFLATADPEVAFSEAELIIVTMPAIMMNQVAEMVFAYANASTIIGTVPGNGGSECAFKKCIERGNTFFAIERVPAIARLIERGKTVRCSGYRKELHVAAMPGDKGEMCAELTGGLFQLPCMTIPCMLNLTLTPSNPILHTARLYTLFKDWHEGMAYDSVPLFYEEWNDKTSELLIAMDDEEQEICKSLSELDLAYVKSLRDHYESQVAGAMTQKIRSIQAFKGLPTPVVSIEGGVVPDLHSRYFTTDFSFGLSIIQQIGRLAEVETPVIDRVMAWYRGIALVKDEFRYSDYGITDKESLLAFYLRGQ